MQNPRILVISSCSECGMVNRITLHTRVCKHPSVLNGSLTGKQIVLNDGERFPKFCPLEEVTF